MNSISIIGKVRIVETDDGAYYDVGKVNASLQDELAWKFDGKKVKVTVEEIGGE